MGVLALLPLFDSTARGWMVRVLWLPLGPLALDTLSWASSQDSFGVFDPSLSAPAG